MSSKPRTRHAFFSERSVNAFVLVTIIAYIVVILGSWLWSAAMPESHVRPILSDSGMRWFFGTLTVNLASPLLVWIILLDIAIGACRKSGMFAAFRKKEQRRGLLPALFMALLVIAVFLVLSLPSGAFLRSATGSLYPSAASYALVPVIAFTLLASAITYGMFAGLIHDYHDALACVFSGGHNLKTILALYVLVAELIYMVVYVLEI